MEGRMGRLAGVVGVVLWVVGSCQVAWGVPLGDMLTVYGDPSVWKIYPNNTITLSLTSQAACKFVTKDTYWHGIYSVKIKIPKTFSAGILFTFYMKGGGDEIDFEIIGHKVPSRALIHTNYYAQGKGQHEEQFRVWYDPSEFHTYTIVYGYRHVLWLIDGYLLREFRQDMKRRWRKGNIFNSLAAYGSVWDASQWATRDYNGSVIRSNYSYAPFTAAFTDFQFNNSCPGTLKPKPACRKVKPPTNYEWDKPLTTKQYTRMKWMRRRYLHYTAYRPPHYGGHQPPGKGKRPPGVGKHPPKIPPPAPYTPPPAKGGKGSGV